MFSFKHEEWETPDGLFLYLNDKFNFNLDPCATPKNAKCKKFYTKNENGLIQDWSGHTVFCNPPYGRNIMDWVEKCRDEGMKENTVVVALLPARTDTRWFHWYVYPYAKIIFLKGRLKFNNSKKSMPFPSMIAVFTRSLPWDGYRKIFNLDPIL